jgi:hypothetical protein
MYDDKIMRNELDACSNEELATALITNDGRGKENKKKALDILLKREYDNGHNNLRTAIGE